MGNYTLKFEANYKVLRNEIYDDYSIFTYSENIQIDSVPVVSAKFEFNKDNYFNINNQNVFPAQNDIKFKVKLENRIDTEIKLKKIEIIPNDCDLQIHSSFCKLIENENLLNLFNENILILKSNSDITIPFNLKCSKNFTGNIGKVVFYWTDIRNNNNPIAIKIWDTQITTNSYSGWQTLAAETVNGVNQVLWKYNDSNHLHLWSLDISAMPPPHQSRVKGLRLLGKGIRIEV